MARSVPSWALGPVEANRRVAGDFRAQLLRSTSRLGGVLHRLLPSAGEDHPGDPVATHFSGRVITRPMRWPIWPVSIIYSPLHQSANTRPIARLEDDWSRTVMPWLVDISTFVSIQA